MPINHTMKHIITITIALGSLASASAQTNLITTNSVAGKTSGGIELTLGGAGTHINGQNEVGADLSISINPFSSRPEVWIGVAQSVYWSPKFAGSTDLFADWSQNIWREKLYANIGWSAGTTYGEDCIQRTGPELTLQYYVSDDAFVYAGVNWDAVVSKGNSGFRYSFGIGLSF